MDRAMDLMQLLAEDVNCGVCTLGMALAASIIVGTWIWTKSRPPPPQRLLWDLSSQTHITQEDSVDVHISRFSAHPVTTGKSGTAPKGGTIGYFKEYGTNGNFLTHLHDDARTLYECFRRGAKVSNNGPCLGWRNSYTEPYQWLHYNETLLRAKNFGSGLICLGLSPQHHPDTSGRNVKVPKLAIVGIYARNCPEWIIAEQAAYSYRMCVVPLYDTLGPDACAFIIGQVEMSLVICDDDAKCIQLLERAPPRCLRHMICIDSAAGSSSLTAATRQRARNRGIDVHMFSDVEAMGAQKQQDEVPPTPADMATICYTSGTTGRPRGVQLTHGNVVASIAGVMLQMGEHRIRTDDVMLSFLPLAHMLERCCESSCYMEGARVGFTLGNIRRLSDDMQALRPTVTPAVPRLLNRIYEQVHQRSRGFVKRTLLKWALRAKEAEVTRGIVRRNSVWDWLVWRHVAVGACGGRIRLMLVGSAPLEGSVLQFMRVALGCVVIEGYGQTECTAPISLTMPGDHTTGHVGPPVACNAVRLIDVPEMSYYAKEHKGEICVRGTNTFKGYFATEGDNEEVDVEGLNAPGTVPEMHWHRTGDIGCWQPNGCLRIIDRRKHIFKLSQGEYIVPERIEAAYSRSVYVQQVYVHGESLKSYIVAIVVPDVDVVKCWACENGIPGTLSVLCAHAEVRRLIMEDMLERGREAGLKSFEQVKDIYLHPDPFSMQNGLLTPTLKAKRPQIKSYFTPQLDDMYKKLG